MNKSDGDKFNLLCDIIGDEKRQVTRMWLTGCGAACVLSFLLAVVSSMAANHSSELKSLRTAVEQYGIVVETSDEVH